MTTALKENVILGESQILQRADDALAMHEGGRTRSARTVKSIVPVRPGKATHFITGMLPKNIKSRIIKIL